MHNIMKCDAIKYTGPCRFHHGHNNEDDSGKNMHTHLIRDNKS